MANTVSGSSWAAPNGAGLRMVAIAILVLNFLDAVLTLAWVELGLAEEANVMLAYVLARSAVGFFALKMGMVCSGLAVLWKQRHRRLALFGLYGTAAAYNLLLLYHFGIAAIAVSEFGL